MDPLSLVRHATTHNIPVKYADSHYIFDGNVSLHESTETAFKRTHKGGGYYTLRDVLFFLEKADQGVAQYRVSVNAANGVTAVVVADSKNLKSYLTGQISSCDQIDPEKLAPIHGSSKGQEVVGHSASTGISRGGPSDWEESDRQEARRRVVTSFLRLPPSSADGFLEHQGDGEFTPQQPILSAEDVKFMTADRGQLASLRADEFAASNRSSVLCKPGGDFGFALKLLNDHVLKPESRKRDGGGGSTELESRKRPGESSHTDSSKRPAGGGRSGCPIFIVPDALTATFSGFNATQFLRDGNFVSSEECRQRGLKRNPAGQRFSHTCKNGKSVEFKVVDNGKKLTKDEWDRVAVVFVQGPAWQFKGWMYSDPVEVFDRALGIHVCLDDGSEVARNVLSWKCDVLKIHKTRRHMDASAFNEFWLLVEDYLRMHRPWLVK